MSQFRYASSRLRSGSALNAQRPNRRPKEITRQESRSPPRVKRIRDLPPLHDINCTKRLKIHDAHGCPIVEWDGISHVRLSLLLRGKDSDRRYSNPAIHYLVYCRRKKTYSIFMCEVRRFRKRIWEHRTKMHNQYIIYDYWSDLKETDTHTDEPCRFQCSFRDTRYCSHRRRSVNIQDMKLSKRIVGN